MLMWCHCSEKSLQWRHDERDGVSYHQPHHCLLNGLFKRRSKKTSKLRVTGLCAGNSPVTGEFPAQMASNAESVSIWWRHHDSLFPVIAFFMQIYLCPCCKDTKLKHWGVLLTSVLPLCASLVSLNAALYVYIENRELSCQLCRHRCHHTLL